MVAEHHEEDLEALEVADEAHHEDEVDLLDEVAQGEASAEEVSAVVEAVASQEVDVVAVDAEEEATECIIFYICRPRFVETTGAFSSI